MACSWRIYQILDRGSKKGNEEFGTLFNRTKQRKQKINKSRKKEIQVSMINLTVSTNLIGKKPN